ncbi:uncharacterized protein F4807DRAFT_81177 [Annulohypoxylon truncatum]|uniref:uncharacterized protein n=1 Tax=Annulohypoxylon truncatum TaxID=327061 RepID=UPI0020083840|nr:uncharacterized protein F4807DRAFT_81177 [Annulohypoxylon truncatum]KAI1209992.1 hypothetical protein F4807DRAFT_81177 [Annulohypoxylon truncatum]
MNNFGVIELATAKTTHAPGWAYVPDTAPSLSASAAAIQPGGHRKRAARNQHAASTSALYADADARQEAKLRREIEALDRDNYGRDASIPIATKSGGGAAKASVKKHTPNVRKILQSQKTFANHLDDFDALSPADRAAAMGHGVVAGIGTGAGTGQGGGGKKGVGEKEKEKEKEREKEKGKGRRRNKSTSRSASVSKAPPAAAVKQEDNDIEMLDAPASDPANPNPDPSSSSLPQHHQHPRSAILTPLPASGYPPPHPLDTDPLIISRVPPLPTDEELKALMRAPPLTYAEARGRWTNADDGEESGGARWRYPARAFCEVCGYWGRVRCLKCGARACALECLETHREECVTRYGI